MSTQIFGGGVVPPLRWRDGNKPATIWKKNLESTTVRPMANPSGNARKTANLRNRPFGVCYTERGN
jgi:hypothetical protein